MIARHHIPLVLAVILAAGCQVNQTTTGQPPVTPSASAPVASAAPSASPSATSVTLRGRVYDEDLNPLAGVTVSAQPTSGSALTATTGADGVYSFAVAAGSYQVTATKTGFTKRQQSVTVNGETTLDFGGLDVKPQNAYFLSTNPEIHTVEVDEKAPGGPMTLKLHFSEPLTEASKLNFLTHLYLETRGGARFLRGTGESEPKLESTTTWDASNQVLTWVYDEPYLPTGPGETVNFNLRLDQVKKDTIDPVTDENEWEDFKITDAEGNPLGKNRADFVFIKPQLQTIGNDELINKAFGYSPAIRRWNLTHTSTFNFTAANDTQGPGLVDAKVDGRVRVGASEYDLMTLHFTEPMRVVRSRDELQFTRLDPDDDKQMLIVNVSENADGSNPKQLGSAFKIDSFRFSNNDPTLVYVRYPSNAFKDMKWVEVTLGQDMRDPANNKPDAAKIRVTGQVTNVEED